MKSLTLTNKFRGESNRKAVAGDIAAGEVQREIPLFRERERNG